MRDQPEGKGPTGPVSEEGKASSSRNAVRHGLTGFALVVPGESVAAYRRCQNDWLAALAPASPVEAHMVTQIADAAWRLDRCMRLEHQHLLKCVEEKMKKTPAFESFSEINSVLRALNALAAALDDLLGRDPMPTTYEALTHFVSGAEGVVGIVRDSGIVPNAKVEQLETGVDGIRTSSRAGTLTKDAPIALRAAVAGLQGVLAPRLEKAERELQQLRLEIGKTAIPHDDKEQKRLARYRTEIEKSQARLFGILKELRATIASAKTTQTPSVKLRLRVVK